MGGYQGAIWGGGSSWTGLVGCRPETSAQILWTRQWTFGFLKRGKFLDYLRGYRLINSSQASRHIQIDNRGYTERTTTVGKAADRQSGITEICDGQNGTTREHCIFYIHKTATANKSSRVKLRKTRLSVLLLHYNQCNTRWISKSVSCYRTH